MFKNRLKARVTPTFYFFREGRWLQCGRMYDCKATRRRTLNSTQNRETSACTHGCQQVTVGALFEGTGRGTRQVTAIGNVSPICGGADLGGNEDSSGHVHGWCAGHGAMQVPSTMYAFGDVRMGCENRLLSISVISCVCFLVFYEKGKDTRHSAIYSKNEYVLQLMLKLWVTGSMVHNGQPPNSP